MVQARKVEAGAKQGGNEGVRHIKTEMCIWHEAMVTC